MPSNKGTRVEWNVESYGQCLFKYMVTVEANEEHGGRTEDTTFSTSITLYGLRPGESYTVIVEAIAGDCHINKSAMEKFTVSNDGELS